MVTARRITLRNVICVARLMLDCGVGIPAVWALIVAVGLKTKLYNSALIAVDVRLLAWLPCSLSQDNCFSDNEYSQMPGTLPLSPRCLKLVIPSSQICLKL